MVVTDLEKTVWSQSSSVSKQDKIAQVDFKTQPTVYLRKVRKCKVAKLVLSPRCLHFPCPIQLAKVSMMHTRTLTLILLSEKTSSKFVLDGRGPGSFHLQRPAETLTDPMKGEHGPLAIAWVSAHDISSLELSKTIQDCWEVRKSNSTWTSRKQGLKWLPFEASRRGYCFVMPVDALWPYGVYYRSLQPRFWWKASGDLPTQRRTFKFIATLVIRWSKCQEELGLLVL